MIQVANLRCVYLVKFALRWPYFFILMVIYFFPIYYILSIHNSRGETENYEPYKDFWTLSSI